MLSPIALTTFFRWGSRFFLPNAIFTLFVVYLVLTFQQATAQSGNQDTPSKQPLVTSTFAYQGFLTTAAGQPITGNRALTFRLYSIGSGGTALWTEVRNTVTIQNGLFHVRLGELIPIPPPVWESSILYLGVQVESEPELTPREPIGLVPIAQQALSGFPKLMGLDESQIQGAVTATSVAGWNPVKGDNPQDNIEVTLSTDGSPLLVMMTARYTFSDPGTPAWCSIQVLEGSSTIKQIELDGYTNAGNIFGCSSSYVISDLPAGTYTFRATGFIQNAGASIMWEKQRQIAVFDLPPIE